MRFEKVSVQHGCTVGSDVKNLILQRARARSLCAPSFEVLEATVWQVELIVPPPRRSEISLTGASNHPLGEQNENPVRLSRLRLPAFPRNCWRRILKKVCGPAAFLRLKLDHPFGGVHRFCKNRFCKRWILERKAPLD